MKHTVKDITDVDREKQRAEKQVKETYDFTLAMKLNASLLITSYAGAHTLTYIVARLSDSRVEFFSGDVALGGLVGVTIAGVYVAADLIGKIKNNGLAAPNSGMSKRNTAADRYRARIAKKDGLGGNPLKVLSPISFSTGRGESSLSFNYSLPVVGKQGTKEIKVLGVRDLVSTLVTGKPMHMQPKPGSNPLPPPPPPVPTFFECLETGMRVPCDVFLKFLKMAEKRRGRGVGLSKRFWTDPAREARKYAWWNPVYYDPCLMILEETEDDLAWPGFLVVYNERNNWKTLGPSAGHVYLLVSYSQYPERFSGHSAPETIKKLREKQVETKGYDKEFILV